VRYFIWKYASSLRSKLLSKIDTIMVILEKRPPFIKWMKPRTKKELLDHNQNECMKQVERVYEIFPIYKKSLLSIHFERYFERKEGKIFILKIGMGWGGIGMVILEKNMPDLKLTEERRECIKYYTSRWGIKYQILNVALFFSVRERVRVIREGLKRGNRLRK
jgi:hypothetical protein